MIATDRIAAVLLCAGLSTRFGDSNKLLAPLHGRPLVSYPAALAASMTFAARIAVLPQTEPDLRKLFAGFELVENPNPEDGKDSSLRIGLEHALAGEPEAVLVMLGDMPNVGAAHLARLCALAEPGRAAISASESFRSPPLVIPANLARQVLAESDRPVRHFLTDAAEARTDGAMLADFDTSADFAQAQSGRGAA